MSKISIRIQAGADKYGHKENFENLDFQGPMIVTIVGPTGPGKSRLLSDIESLSAEGDWPSKRRIFAQGRDKHEISVARISQSMQFFLDLTVRELLELHAQAQGKEGVEEEVPRALNLISDEKVFGDEPLSSLSGGQARALMVADAVILSDAPVVLVDEIENAGINRHKALKFLLKKGVLAFVATHDPLIALKGATRLVMKEGGIAFVHRTTDKERREGQKLLRMDRYISKMQDLLRRGGVIG
jgi:ABC-type lipoprotein export system ATPase subunit